MTNFRGVTLALRGDDTLHAAATGFRDLPNRLKNTLHTRFAIASGSKAFTAAGVLLLVRNRVLTLDTKLGELVKRDLGTVDKGVTVYQLLTHTAGVPDYFNETVMDDYEALWHDFPNYRVRQSADLLPLMTSLPMLYKPGERFQYNNSGYVLLALMIEAATGEAFDAYLSRALFRPLRMNSTGYYAFDRLPARCANAYIPTDDGYRTNIYSVDAKGGGAGGAFTTGGDVWRFFTGLADDRLLGKALYEQMLAPHAGQGNERYGLGVWVAKDAHGNDCPALEGCDPGVCFYAKYRPSDRLFVCALSNYQDDVWRVGGELWQRCDQENQNRQNT